MSPAVAELPPARVLVVGRDPLVLGIVIDEIAAMLLVLFFTGTDLARIALAFLLFRLFDILKPPPIRAIDARMKNGIGVMVDDLVAAGMALVAFALIVRVTGWPA